MSLERLLQGAIEHTRLYSNAVLTEAKQVIHMSRKNQLQTVADRRPALISPLAASGQTNFLASLGPFTQKNHYLADIGGVFGIDDYLRPQGKDTAVGREMVERLIVVRDGTE